jgi:hypothetical protein
MKAFDFDGVLVPDFDYVDIDQTQFEQVWLAINPIFEPKHNWIIITGRSDPTLIWKWCNKHLTNLPKMVYANTNNIDPAEHKLQTLNKLGLTNFVESDLTQVGYLIANNINCKWSKQCITKVLQ